MKRYILPISFLLIVVLPNILFSLLWKFDKVEEIPNETISVEKEEAPRVLIENKDQIFEMELDDYVLCVLLGEVPADFSFEALKAQAVATRTFTIRNYIDRNKHADAHLCTDASCCQAYIPTAQYLENGHTQEELQRMIEAVNATAMEVLTYQGDLIEATYFSCSGGKTEAAVDVWGNDVPYLISVESPGEEMAKSYTKTSIFTEGELKERLAITEDITVSKENMIITYTMGSGIKQLRILDHVYSGPEVRKLLDLPSTNMAFSFENGLVEIITLGNGHRVGMSQYGADVMAASGYDYAEILMHYYPGTTLTTLNGDQIKGIFDKA